MAEEGLGDDTLWEGDSGMNGKEIIEHFEAGKNRPLLVRVNKEIFDEVGLEAGCKAYVISCREDHNADGGCIHIDLDFTEFEEENKKLMPKVWHGGPNGTLLHWYETYFYPKGETKTVELYADKEEKYDCGIDVFAKTPTYIEWENYGKGKMDYVTFLEGLVKEMTG